MCLRTPLVRTDTASSDARVYFPLPLLPTLTVWTMQHTVGTNWKNPPKIRLEKFVKLKDHIGACNDLTNFECEAQANINKTEVMCIPRNLNRKTREINLGELIIRQILVIWNHCVAVR